MFLQQLQSLSVLQMDILELEEYIRTLSLENPLIELADYRLFEKQAFSRLRQAEMISEKASLRNEDDDSFPSIEDHAMPESLFDHLSGQIGSLKISAREKEAVLYLASCLNSSGYLDSSLPDLSRESGMSFPELERGLRILQSLDPPGIGATDLSNCLLLQLQASGSRTIAAALVSDWMPELSRHDFSKIARALHVKEKEIAAAFSEIQALDPRPGNAFPSRTFTPYITPDVEISDETGTLTIRHPESERPLFRINEYYSGMLSSLESGSVREYLLSKMKQANDLEYALKMRRKTILACAEYLAEKQYDFFIRGPAFLKPLQMKDASAALGISVSTVSRTARSKYISCKYGVFPIGYFFPACSGSSGSSTVSSISAQTRISELIRSEDPHSPYSDEMISSILSKSGCAISRRTVAKYRQILKIPSASERKRKSKTGECIWRR